VPTRDRRLCERFKGALENPRFNGSIDARNWLTELDSVSVTSHRKSRDVYLSDDDWLVPLAHGTTGSIDVIRDVVAFRQTSRNK